MSKDQPDAVSFFRGHSRNNCAQAVVKAYAHTTGADEFCVERFAGLGSGRAPEGECGALFAAKSMLADAAARQALQAAFTDAAGAAACREIRRLGHLSCRQCVETAANQLFMHVSQGQELQQPANCRD